MVTTKPIAWHCAWFVSYCGPRTSCSLGVCGGCFSSIYSYRELWSLLHREPTVYTQELQRNFGSIFLYLPNLGTVCFCFQGPGSTFLLLCSPLQGLWKGSGVLATIILSLVMFLQTETKILQALSHPDWASLHLSSSSPESFNWLCPHIFFILFI